MVLWIDGWARRERRVEERVVGEREGWRDSSREGSSSRRRVRVEGSVGRAERIVFSSCWRGSVDGGWAVKRSRWVYRELWGGREGSSAYRAGREY